jgi:hypothetical protein
MSILKLWHILTTPGTELLEEVVGSGKEAAWQKLLIFLSEYLDPVATIIALVCLLLIMLGSRTAGKILYWDIALFILLKLLIIV